MHIKTGGGNINIVIGFDPVDFPDGQVIKNSVLWRSSGNGNNNKEEHSEIRLKGEGGYIVAPPSIHPNGNQYGFVNEVSSPIRLSKEQIFNLIAILKQQQSTTTALQTENIKSNENGIATTSSIEATNQNQSCEFGKENLSNIIACLKTYYRQGERNDFVMYLAGWFRKEGVAIQSAIKVVEELAENDEEKQARFRTVEETYKKQDLNGINGYSGLLSILTGQLQSKEKASQLLNEVKLLFPVPKDRQRQTNKIIVSSGRRRKSC